MSTFTIHKSKGDKFWQRPALAPHNNSENHQLTWFIYVCMHEYYLQSMGLMLLMITATQYVYRYDWRLVISHNCPACFSSYRFDKIFSKTNQSFLFFPTCVNNDKVNIISNYAFWCNAEFFRFLLCRCLLFQEQKMTWKTATALF